MKITQNKYWHNIKSIIPKQLFEPLLDLYYCIQRVAYSGNNVYCPICECKSRKFLNNTCPKCGSGIRHRVLWLFLVQRTNFFKDRLKVLHFAPEHCLFSRMKGQKNLEYLSADLSSPRAMMKIDMTNINFTDNYFDVVLSSHVLEHIDDDKQAMRELYRVQKEGGWSIHLVPIDYTRTHTLEDPLLKSPEERQKVYGHYDHKRIYGTDYKERLESTGFNVEIFKIEDFCKEEEIKYMELKSEAEIFYCKK